tara:strand:+ start:968 stop:1105 length:138 start_codon:yes stop_codon:yes gene_type:complete
MDNILLSDVFVYQPPRKNHNSIERNRENENQKKIKKEKKKKVKVY